MDLSNEELKKFCAACLKEGDPEKSVEVDGKTYFCKDCMDTGKKGEKKPAICEFC